MSVQGKRAITVKMTSGTTIRVMDDSRADFIEKVNKALDRFDNTPSLISVTLEGGSRPEINVHNIELIQQRS